jgi:hypothetical protein
VGRTDNVDSRLACTASTGTGFSSTAYSKVLDWGLSSGSGMVDFSGDHRVDFCALVGNKNNVDSSIRCLVSTVLPF